VLFAVRDEGKIQGQSGRVGSKDKEHDLSKLWSDQPRRVEPVSRLRLQVSLGIRVEGSEKTDLSDRDEIQQEKIESYFVSPDRDCDRDYFFVLTDGFARSLVSLRISGASRAFFATMRALSPRR
jgi:hypothetical protein